MITGAEIIAKLKLQEHPLEGGYFAETFRSVNRVETSRYGERSMGTAIYFMLTPGTFSEIHRLGIEEIYHFYLGDPVEMLNLYPDGTAQRIILGHDLKRGMSCQVMVAGEVWQGSRLLPGGGKNGFALMGTTMAPGFEYRDYCSGKRAELVQRFPQYKELVTALTH